MKPGNLFQARDLFEAAQTCVVVHELVRRGRAAGEISLVDGPGERLGGANVGRPLPPAFPFMGKNWGRRRRCWG